MPVKNTKKAINIRMINVFLKLNFALPFLSISEVAFWVNISWIGDITKLRGISKHYNANTYNPVSVTP